MSLCTRQQQKSESQATHFLLSIHRFFMIFLCVSLFVCLLPFYIYLHIFYLYFIYLWFSAKKMKERKINYLFIAKISCTTTKATRNPWNKKKINLMWKFQNRKRKRNFYSYFFRNLLTLIFLHHRYWESNMHEKIKSKITFSHLYYCKWSGVVMSMFDLLYDGWTLSFCNVYISCFFFIKLNYSLLLSPHH